MRLKQTIIILLVFASLLNTQAQQDSLDVISLIEKSHDIDDLDRSIELLESALQISDENKLVHLSIKTREELVQLYVKNESDYEAVRTYFQLETVYNQREEYQKLFELYIGLADYYEKKELPNNSASYVTKALDLAEEQNLNINKERLWYKIAVLKFSALEYDEAMKYLSDADAALSMQADRELLILVLRLNSQCQEKLNMLNDALSTNERILDLLNPENEWIDYSNQLNNLGFIHKRLGNNAKAIEYFRQTLKIKESHDLNDKENIVLLVNLGIAYQNVNQLKNSKDYLLRAEAAISESDIENRAQIYDLLAIAHLSENDIYTAQFYNDKSLDIIGKEFPETEMELYLTASMINERILEYQEALKYYKEYLDIKDSLNLIKILSQEELLQRQLFIEKNEKEIQAINAKNEIKDYQLEQLKLESENKDIQLKNQELAAREKLQNLQLKQQELEQQKTEQELLNIKAKEENQRLQLKQKELQEEQRIKELKLAEKQVEIQDLELAKRRSMNRNLLIIVSLTLIISILALWAFIRIRKSNKLINIEKAKSDKLLLNILPSATAEELKSVGRSLPRKYEKVAVLFTDFKGFTMISEKMTPESLVESLDLYFAGFDDIMKKHGLEKIKTIGDAYMCAAGIPEPLEDPSYQTVLAAKEMIELTEKLNADKRNKGEDTWGIRIGIHTGPVVAGVIGNHKFQYDIWGDAVNLASRMESSGEAGKINISESTYNDIKNQFSCSYRGEVSAKNKGMVKMYFVE